MTKVAHWLICPHRWIAMLWYTISFIPFARDWVCMCCCQAPRDFCKKHGIEIRYK